MAGNESLAAGRIYHSGKKDEGLHLVDLNMYDSSLFANSCIIEDDGILVLLDAGTSRTAGQLINYITFHGLPHEEIYIIPSHHHFDHAGGISILSSKLREIGARVSIMTNDRMAPLLTDLKDAVAPARKQFSRLLGTVADIDKGEIEIIRSRGTYSLNKHLSIKLLETPGHADDHVSPVIFKDGVPWTCFFGEAMGINLHKHLSPLPATAAPSYRKDLYIESVKKIKKLDVEIGIFSHVGGVVGQERIKNLCDVAIDKLDEITKFIQDVHATGIHSTRGLVKMMLDRYQAYIATCVMDKGVVRNLAFLIVYGIMMDLGIK
ncbi:MBL fold metallo-hydrolase [Candidatus Bathyarchaeota archaeon]|nr:MBL fold metallo-hydrolase [Candidatus Bathyarchaeota archaeon]